MNWILTEQKKFSSCYWLYGASWQQTRTALLLFALAMTLLLSSGCQTTSFSRLAEEAEVALETSDLVPAIPLLPVSAEDAEAPATLSIPELGLTLDVVSMGWSVTETNGQLTTKWIVPTDAVGWHVNSARAGTAGNLILSGHQMIGDALFAPLALGDVMVGQEVLLTDIAGTVFTYQVVELSEPIPILGATDDDAALARSYLQPSEVPILTMMTGWPDFTTTHRIFAVAELVISTDGE